MIKEHKDLLAIYAKVKIEIKKLEAEADEMSPKVLEIMQENEAQEIEISDVGKLSMGGRRTWIYSDRTKEKEIELKEQKKEEERRGIADYTEKKYVIFKAI